MVPRNYDLVTKNYSNSCRTNEKIKSLQENSYPFTVQHLQRKKKGNLYTFSE